MLGLSVSASGLAVIALMGGTVTGATICGRVMMHVRHYKIMPLCGLLVAASGTGAARLEPVRACRCCRPSWCCWRSASGVGTVLPVTTVCIQNAVPLHQLGTATATMNFFRSLGGALLVAGFGAILLGHVGASTAELLQADTAGAPAGLSTTALAEGFRWVFIAAAIGLAARDRLAAGDEGAAAARLAADSPRRTTDREIIPAKRHGVGGRVRPGRQEAKSSALPPFLCHGRPLEPATYLPKRQGVGGRLEPCHDKGWYQSWS